jgi:pimeloyl-ACP methyl ester carboxylesterase
MQRAALNGIGLEYEVRGMGEPVLLVHGALVADWFAPLMAQPNLTERYRLINYHRIGYGGSTRVNVPVSIADQAAHCRALLEHLGVECAHVVGHSSGANIAMQLALDAPQSVRSLALLEIVLTGVPSDREYAERNMAPDMRHYGAGEKAEAVDAFLHAGAGPAYRAAMDRTLPPGYFAQAVADADAFFGTELPAVRQWRLAREDAERITQPVMAVLGGKSDTVSPVFQERHELLLSLLSQAESFVLPGVTHLTYVQDPQGLASGLAEFFGRHPIPSPD